MNDWFAKIAAVRNPARGELTAFVEQLREFLAFALKSPDFKFLWKDDPKLRALALETFEKDVVPAIDTLKATIPGISTERLTAHGLIGRPARFKYRVIAAISKAWKRVKGSLKVREWFKKILDAIDALLDSLIDAAGGAGGIIKEFKDALSALAPTL